MNFQTGIAKTGLYAHKWANRAGGEHTQFLVKIREILTDIFIILLLKVLLFWIIPLLFSISDVGHVYLVFSSQDMSTPQIYTDVLRYKSFFCACLSQYRTHKFFFLSVSKISPVYFQVSSFFSYTFTINTPFLKSISLLHIIAWTSSLYFFITFRMILKLTPNMYMYYALHVVKTAKW